LQFLRANPNFGYPKRLQPYRTHHPADLIRSLLRRDNVTLVYVDYKTVSFSRPMVTDEILVGMQRRVFSREFKLEAVELIRERGVAVVQASRDLDLGEGVLRRRRCQLGELGGVVAAYPA
jgi:hypothetical protein